MNDNINKMNKILSKHSFGIYEHDDYEFSFHTFTEKKKGHEQKIISHKMNTKLYNYKFKLFEHEESEFSFYVLAENEQEAKKLILQKTENELYKTELKKKFENVSLKPNIYEKNDVFIQHT
jgi:hypothetical protein